jgi:hypothetical protein
VSTDTRFAWLVTESLAATVMGELRVAGVTIDADAPRQVTADEFGGVDDAGFEPLLLLSGAAALSLLARTISRIVRDHIQGGVVIDGRHEQLDISAGVRGVNAGSIVVVTNSGSEVFHSPDELELVNVLSR